MLNRDNILFLRAKVLNYQNLHVRVVKETPGYFGGNEGLFSTRNGYEVYNFHKVN